MFRKVGILFLIGGIVSTLIIVYSVWRNSIPLISPVALINIITGKSNPARSPKIIYGFFPYWNIKYADQLNIQPLTHFAYFAVDLNPDGSINKQNISKELEPGWNKLNSKPVQKILYQAKLLNQRTVLTITAMDPDTIESILNDLNHFQQALDSILAVYQNSSFSDLNIDFEYVGEPSVQTRESFVRFIKTLKEKCLSINQDCSIDIDIFGDTAEKYRLWDLKNLSSFTDHFIVMAYDYYRKSSTQAGPVAPISGKCTSILNSELPCLNQDIMSHLSLIAKIVPSEKIILGVPFYGYEWQTASTDFLANTYSGTGSLATYSRIMSLTSDPSISSLSAMWSKKTLSPYLTFQKNGQIHQIHFENSQSLLEKVKLIKSANLGGIAIWALGYEGSFSDLWGPINELTTP